MKQTIGWALMCSPVITIFFLILHLSGLEGALITFGLATGIVAVISLGAYLSIGDDDV